MSTPLDNYLKEVKSRLEKATPGPWAVDGNYITKIDKNGAECIFIARDSIHGCKEDLPFIASAPSDLIRLIKICEVLIHFTRCVTPFPNDFDVQAQEALNKVNGIAEEGE